MTIIIATFKKILPLHLYEVLEQATLISGEKRKHRVASWAEVECEYCLDRGKEQRSWVMEMFSVFIWMLRHMGVSVCYNSLYCSLKIRALFLLQRK